MGGRNPGLASRLWLNSAELAVGQQDGGGGHRNGYTGFNVPLDNGTSAAPGENSYPGRGQSTAGAGWSAVLT